MNAQASDCNRNRINDFLSSDPVGFDDAELVRHLDTCAACRQYLETQAAEPERWSKATELLQPSEFDRAGSAECSAATLGQEQVEPTAAIQHVIDSLAPSEDPNRLGRLGCYEVSGIIGVGGMGVVLKAVDPALDRVVAIKVMAPHLAHNATARKRFSREAKAAAAVLHPNVIPIHCVSNDDKNPYLVMAYIRGGSLQKRLDREGPLSTVEILRIGSQVAAGLAAAHDQGLIHRDIKPENVLLEDGVERVTLTDFGLARAVDDTSVTREGTIAGTPQYMSPEQSRGESIDQKSDLFSLGSVLYTLCTGRPPFRADSSYGVMRRISDATPTPIRELNPDIPEWLVGIIAKLMAKEKSERFDSAGEVRELLEACLSHVQQPTAVSLPSQWLTKEKPTFGKPRELLTFYKTIGALSMLSLLIATAWGLFLFQGETQSPQNASETKGEVVGHGYTRKGEFIYFDGRRIDQAGKEDIDAFAKFTDLDLTLCSNVDAASFKALSEEYSKDKNKVYYKWISPDRFWVVELPKADVKSFEVVGFNFAKDSKNVWWYGSILPEVDPATVEIVNDGFVWKDATSVWYQHEKITNADVETFRHLEQAFYGDATRVYWSSTPLEGADPQTFRTFGDDSPYGADRNGVWKGDTRITGLDAATFEPVHQSVYKDKNGVYASGYPIKDADPKTFRKVVNLDQHFTALLADADNYYIFLPFRGEVFLLEPTADSLKVSRQIWPPGTPQHRQADFDPVAITTAELRADGWSKHNVASELDGGAIKSLKDQESHLFTIYQQRFTKAWDILREGTSQASKIEKKPSEQVPTSGKVAAEAWRTDVVAFDKFLGELVAKGRVPNQQALAKRIKISPQGKELNSEVIPVTKGAGGYIDLKPAEDTVQFRANEALKGQKVTWEFTLGSDVIVRNGGIVLMPQSITNQDAKDTKKAIPFLSAIMARVTRDQAAEMGFKTGDRVKVEGTIGDFSSNKGIAALQSPAGPVAVYHLDSAPHPIFWVGLIEVKITGPKRKSTPLRKPAADVAKVAKAALRANFQYDEQAIKAIYTEEVLLLPGNRLFHFGLELPAKMTPSGVVVKRDNMLPALKKQAERDPAPESIVALLVDEFRIEQLDVPAGEFVTEPNQPSDSLYGKLNFTIEENDALIKISVPDAFRYLQLRKVDEQWKVVAEY